MQGHAVGVEPPTAHRGICTSSAYVPHSRVVVLRVQHLPAGRGVSSFEHPTLIEMQGPFTTRSVALRAGYDFADRADPSRGI